ncbi:MAG: pyruvate dehydrogenase complex dihydrolipoamide acetyltransferase [Sphingomonadales bacterium]|nr:pyruvate dehydrogenase complex dihydrolipoamide acetyltransferase [Sphingomonadales bacterium]
MAIELMMPALSPTMEKGTLAKWLVKVGDHVQPGDLIAEIETDKATMEFEAIDGGRVAELVVAEGTDDVPVGTVIARLALLDEPLAAQAPIENAAPTAEPGPVALPADVTTLSPLVKTIANETANGPFPAPQSGGKVTITSLVRKIADVEGIDISSIVGSGSNGRIVMADLGLALRSNAPATLTLPAPVPPPSAATLSIGKASPPPNEIPVETVKLSTMRKTIARRLSESKQTIPHFYLTARCNIDRLLKLRIELNEPLAARGIRLSVNDMLMKAMALAMVEVPESNVQFGGDHLYRFGRVDLAMAVAIEGGLVTPVVRDVAALSLSALALQTRALAERARDGALTPVDYEGGTASISNLGMFGIDEMFPVINPPQALILGIGAGVEQPWKVEGALALATIMAATASFDHRAIDGAIAARFMAALRARVEDPWSICC